MFQNFYWSSTIALSIIFVQPMTQAAAPSPSAYPYQANLNGGPVQVSQRVEAKILNSSLRFIRPDFGNVQVLDDLNGQPDFVVYDQPARQLRAINAVELSSKRDDDDPQNLIDDNRLTVFAFSQKISANEPATILVDFGKLVELHRIEIWPTFTANIVGMQLRAGTAEQNLKTLKRQTEFKPVIDGDYAPLRWLEISLWGTNIVLEDLNFFEKAQATVYFTGEPERRYRLLFGDMNLDNKRFSKRVSEAQAFDQTFNFTNPQFNALASTDFDDDGVLNQFDNCPLVRNPSQADQDGDGIGDACDNAVGVKNYSQLDVDQDGVGDLIDNCKLEANPDQKDRDNDGVGDVCDNAYSKESVFEKWTGNAGNSDNGSIPYGFVGVILALIAVAGIGITVGRKK